MKNTVQYLMYDIRELAEAKNMNQQYGLIYFLEDDVMYSASKARRSILNHAFAILGHNPKTVYNFYETEDC